ncbi:hypothetical protein QIU19_10985 [Capnocytophaga canimorsus]|nr:hypothetical protein [Capnocytophaga canimorsus]WGU67920.1 hypothetical protein QIU19_10985 [Capnocytophaga canimorsus]
MHYIKYVLLVWIVIQSSFLKAQQYPIDVQVFVTPPISAEFARLLGEF